MPKTPCHVIAGPLGVGKTTAILDYLRQQPAGSKIGVLVNDFGPVGLDRAKLNAESPTTEVVTLQGGCICCTLLASLPEAVARLVDEHELDRLIIEPSGMASPAQAINALRQPEMRDRISMQPTVVMLSAVEFDELQFERMAYYRMLCDVADVLVFNRADRVGESKRERIQTWAERLTPPKLRVIVTAESALPADVFDGAAAVESAEKSLDEDAHAHQFDASAKAGGATLGADVVFDERVLTGNLQRLSEQGIAGNDVLRFKGVFQTEEAWRSIDLANGRVTSRPSAYRGQTLIEWVTRPCRVDSERMLAELQRPVGSAIL